MINIKNSFVALTLLLSLKAVATPLSPTEALQRYEKQHSYTISRTNDTATFKIKLTVEQPGTLTPALYVFEKTDNNGFIILSADDIAPAVLGYCDNGKIDDDNIPPSFRYWLDEYSRQIAYLIKNNTSSLSGFSRATEILGDPVETMVETYWNQGTPYNNMCPEIGRKKCYTGCVATSMAQVMRYFKYPDVGAGNITYYPFDENVPYSMDFSEKRFDWDNMIDTYQGQNYTQDQADAVAYLMKACGYSVYMSYGVSVSGALANNISPALIKYFKYASTTKISWSENERRSEWINELYMNLKNVGPAIINGLDSEGSGHSFICDGYNSEGYFHINWGWGGRYDGFFLIDALNPSGDDGYNYGQSSIVGIQPESLENGGSLIIDNIFYLVDGETQTATCMGPASDDLTFENLVIPAYVNFMGIDIPVTSIGDGAFFGCSTLTTIDLSGCTELQSIEEAAFGYCSTLTTIGDTSGWTKLQSIGARAFADCSNLTTIDLSGCTELQSIGDWAFDDCSNLTTIGDTSGWTKLQSIGEGAFFCCSSFTKINLSGCTELESIGEGAFAYCSTLTTIDLSGCTKLQSIGNSTFFDCSSFTEINLSGCTELQSIGDAAFAYCSSLTTIDLSCCTELQSIGNSTFYGCLSLTDVKLPSSVTSMAFCDFAYCYNLTSVTCYAEEPPVVDFTISDQYNSTEFFSEPMTTSGILYVRAGSEEKYRNAAGWKDAYRILPIVYEDETFTVNGVNYQTLSETTCAVGDNSDFDGPTELTIPATVIHNGQKYAVIEIIDKAFSNSDNLVIIDLSGCTQLKTIGDYVFNNCSSLLSVILPSTLKNIGTDFLAGCNSLETIVSYATEPPVISPSADNYRMRILSSAKALSSKTVLFVPASSVAAYESAEGWNEVSLTLPIGGVETLMLPMSAEVTEEEATEIEAVYTPSTAPSPEIEWTISDENRIAMLHEKLGEPYTVILEAISDGKCTLTAYNPQTGLKAECEVTVMTSSGIESLFDDDNDAPIDVFDLNGRVVKLNVESSRLKELSKGIYIIRQGKTAKKVIVR